LEAENFNSDLGSHIRQNNRGFEPPVA